MFSTIPVLSTHLGTKDEYTAIRRRKRGGKREEGKREEDEREEMRRLKVQRYEKQNGKRKKRDAGLCDHFD